MFSTLEAHSVLLEMTGIARINGVVIFCRTEFPSKVDITLKTTPKTSNELHAED